MGAVGTAGVLRYSKAAWPLPCSSGLPCLPADMRLLSNHQEALAYWC